MGESEKVVVVVVGPLGNTLVMSENNRSPEMCSLWECIDGEIETEVQKAEHDLMDVCQFPTNVRRDGTESGNHGASVGEEVSLITNRMYRDLEERTPNTLVTQSEEAEEMKQTMNVITNEIMEQLENPSLIKSVRQEMESIRCEALMNLGVRWKTDGSKDEVKVEWYILCELLKKLSHHVQRQCLGSRL